MESKIINNGKLLETIISSEVQKEYLHYFYNNKFYRLVKYAGEIIQVIKIKRENLSELAIYNLMK